MYASAPSGSGKTHQIIARACQLATDDKRVLILQPTKELISKTVEQELNRQPKPPQCRVFHGDTVSGSVAGELTRFFNEPEHFAQIVFATHQVLPHIPYIANKSDWHVLVDEELQVLRYRCHQIPKTHSLITDHIELEPYNSIYSRVAGQGNSLEKHAKNKDRDEILEVLSETMRTLINPHWETYVNTEQYERLRRGEVKRLAFHSILKPKLFDGFASVYMTAANFEDTSVYQLWGQTEEFKQDQGFDPHAWQR
jgi:Rad3-related DNA helicase